VALVPRAIASSETVESMYGRSERGKPAKTALGSVPGSREAFGFPVIGWLRKLE